MRELKGLRDYIMAPFSPISRVRGLRLGLHLSLIALGWCLADASLALARVELYQGLAPLADRSEASQEGAFQAALRAVLVKVTGRRGADQDPALVPLVSSARRYVQQYRAAPDGQILVTFDGAAIDRWLTQNDQPLWGRERPTTVLWLAVQTGPQTGAVVTAEDTSELKLAIDAAAMLRGAPVVWPSAADLARNHLDYAGIVSTSAGTLADVGHRLGGDGTLIGRANGATDAAVVRWTFLYQDHGSEFTGPAVEGIHRAADTYAGLYAVTGALAPVDIEVAGIADLKDYAAAQSYLESLSFISHVDVESLSGDTVRFRLTTRGGAESLHALALGGRLQPIAAGENGVPRFQLTH
jgi:uncharacterized protein